MRKENASMLSKILILIDWRPIRKTWDEMYDNRSEKGGRLNYDVILRFKILGSSLNCVGNVLQGFSFVLCALL